MMLFTFWRLARTVQSSLTQTIKQRYQPLVEPRTRWHGLVFQLHTQLTTQSRTLPILYLADTTTRTSSRAHSPCLQRVVRAPARRVLQVRARVETLRQAPAKVGAPPPPSARGPWVRPLRRIRVLRVQRQVAVHPGTAKLVAVQALGPTQRLRGECLGGATGASVARLPGGVAASLGVVVQVGGRPAATSVVNLSRALQSFSKRSGMSYEYSDTLV